MPTPGLRAIYATDGDDWVILVDRHLPPVERLAAITHELVHHERGGGSDYPGRPDAWAPVVRREEHRVDGIVAERLVPRADLVAFVNALIGIDMPVSAAEVAEEFEVPVDVAQHALQQMRNRRTG
ncbi:MAG: IrrE N-terminal-like domain [Actinomycetia bacterium]|nr:IrrE N-terminal-like domain [Actinomycetes bacterium]